MFGGSFFLIASRHTPPPGLRRTEWLSLGEVLGTVIAAASGACRARGSGS